MFPMVPYYNLPQLHEEVKSQMPKPYNSMWEVYREMIPDLIRQCSDPDFFTQRSVPPPPAKSEDAEAAAVKQSLNPDADGWVLAVAVDEVAPGEVARFEVGPKSYAVYHAEDDGLFYATAGKCTHGEGQLADGLVLKDPVLGNLIECPKHNGCFDFKTGEPKRPPVRFKLATYATKVEGQNVFVQVGGAAGKHKEISYEEQYGEDGK